MFLFSLVGSAPVAHAGHRQSAPSSGPKPERPLGSCFSSPFLNVSDHDFVVCWQAKRAVQRGATAVIFDVSENPDAIDQVCTHGITQHSPCETV